ncbi:TonB-dependent receptor family protein [Flavobacterium tegetincola]|uniref:TonB-dependent receptor family protein n=1 Tax=Flavobacterium tegetincola TaxID=150172 RepID=UPI0003FAE2EA|nr:TonB-dependent receptor [Flavobacterium tegetincola]
MKNQIFLILCFLCAANLFAQEYQFTIFNASTNQPVENVQLFHEGKLITFSNREGVFIVPKQLVGTEVKLQKMGFETRSKVLNAENVNQILFLKPLAEVLSEVIVRSSSIPQTIQKAPASINIVNSADFSRTDATNILESFNNAPGIYVNQGALNTNKISIRGIGARSQYSTNRIQSYYDGIPIATAEGDLTLDDFDQESVERIEIIKGPTSSIYGAGLGGSINLFSKTFTKEKNQANVSSQFGSFNTYKQVIQASTSDENASFFATLSNLTSDGSRENGKYKRTSALVNGSIKSGTRGKFTYLANFTKLKAFIPSSLNEENFINNPEIADASWAASQGFESYDRGILGGSYSTFISDKISNTTSVFVSFRDGYEPRPFDILNENRISTGVRTRFNLHTKLFERPSEISFGGEYYKEWYEMGTFKNLYKDFPDQGSILGERLSSNEQDRNYSNFFAQINVDILEKWNLELGFNINTTQYGLIDLFVQDGVNQTGDYKFETILSPRIGTSYEISPGKNIYASVSQGFSTPNVAETLTPEGQINTNLEPETGTNYEMGFKGNWLDRNLYTEIAVFSIQIENLLVAKRVGEDQYVGINAGSTNHNGIEFLTNYRVQLSKVVEIKPYLSTALNFFKFDEFIDNDSDFSGKKLPGVPSYTVNVGIDLATNNGFEFFGNFRSIGEMQLNDANTGTTDSYQLLNFKAAYSFTVFENLKFNIYSGINNALDKQYAASIVTNATGFGGNAPRYYYPGNPRNYYGGLQVNYLF